MRLPKNVVARSVRVAHPRGCAYRNPRRADPRAWRGADSAVDCPRATRMWRFNMRRMPLSECGRQ
jgi:hypothetical protein